MLTLTSRRALLFGSRALVLAGGIVAAGAMFHSVPDDLDLALEKPTTAGLCTAAIAPQATTIVVRSMHVRTVTVRSSAFTLILANGAVAVTAEDLF